MLFAVLLKAKGATPAERTARRLQWQYPEGLRPVAEYWLGSAELSVIAIVEADDVRPLTAVTMQWGDVFDVTVVPAITAEEGLQLAQQMMQQPQQPPPQQ